MALEELKLNRQMTITKIELCIEKADKNIESAKRRIVTGCRDELKDLLSKFETLHIQVANKEKSSLDSMENMTMFSSVQRRVSEAVDKADEYLFNEESKDLAEVVIKKMEEIDAAGEEVKAELEMMEKTLEWMQQSKDGEFRTDHLAVSAGIVSSDQKMLKIKEMEEFILTNEPDANNRKQCMKKVGELIVELKRLQLRLKSHISRSQQSSTHNSRANSRNNSPRRDRSSPEREKDLPPDRGGGIFGGGGTSGGECSDADDDDYPGFTGFDSSEQSAAGRNLNAILNSRVQGDQGYQGETGRVGGLSQRSSSTVPPREERQSSSVEFNLGNLQLSGQQQSRSSSMDRGSSSRASTTTNRSANSSIFKPKKIEFPKFGGSIRAYNTFRRDFRMIVEDSGCFSEDQMSLLLRNECLQGAPKNLVHNIYEYAEIWEKLNESYDDEAQVVQLITQQITSFREIPEDDMDGFVNFVEMIEKAFYDLQAYQSTDVLSNPVTVQTILEKCPNWAQQHLTREMSVNKISRSKEFKFIRQGLTQLKTQARRLSKLNEKKKPKSDGKKGGRGAVNVVDSQTDVESVSMYASSSSSSAPPRNAAGAASRPNSSSTNGWKCYVPSCTYKPKHMLGECRAYKKLDVNARGKIVKERKLCVICHGANHDASNCTKKQIWRPCDVGGCGKWHSRLLHGATVHGLVLAIPGGGAVDDIGGVVLLVQQVPVHNSRPCTTFWDHGSTTALITYKYAEENHLKGESCRFELSGVGDNKETFNTKLFSVPLVAKDGTVHNISAFGIEKITSPSINSSMAEAVKQFDGLEEEDVDMSSEEVDLLVGMGNVSIMPTKISVQGELALFSSIFGTGRLLGGSTRGGAAVSEEGVEQLAHIVAATEARNVKMDFLSAEAYGVEVPKRCTLCRGCKECNFKNNQLSFEELTELGCIEKNLSLDVAAEKWTTSYAFKQDPSVLQDNYQQAFACMASTERRLKKKNQLAAFDEQFMETVERGIFKEVTQEELEEYKGPINYISIVEAYKPGPHSTTPLRLCMNSSLKFRGISLNDIMMKGPSALNDILAVTLGFRSHQIAIVKDISKFYQSVLVVERDQHLRRVLHRPGGELMPPKIYKTTSVNFGDKQAGCVAQCALRSTAEIYQSIDVVSAEKIKEDTYVDDTISGEKDRETAIKVSANMDKIAAKGGFLYKETIMSGDPSTTGEPRKVLGLGWDSETDTVYVGTNVNVSAKKKGIKEFPDIEIEEIVEKFPEVITRRIIWRVVLGQYDILGLISVFTIKLKLIMKKLIKHEDEKVKWDEPVAKEIRDEFLQTLHNLLELKKIHFPRSVVPAGADNNVKPTLMIFADGSQSAFCSLVYLRSQMRDGSFKCRLVAGKTRVAPSKKISVPRMELMGALTAVRLAKTVEEGLRLEVGQKWFFTDNSAVLGMILRPSGSFQEFVGTRVGEIRSKSEPESEWFWVATDKNLADMGTRSNVLPADMMPDSSYQCGQPWMRLPRSEWPVTQTPGKVPEEELVPAAKVNVAIASVKTEFFPVKKFSTLSKAANCLSLVAKAAQNIKNRTKGRNVNAEDTDKAEIFLLFQAQHSVRLAFEKGQLETLRPQLLECNSYEPVKLVVTAGRLEDKLLVGYDKKCLPILKLNDDLSVLYMQEAHQMDHGGVDRTLQRSRNHVWIIQGRRLAKQIVVNCLECKIRNKKLQGQVMAPIHESRLPPSPVFDSTAVDLFGPLLIVDSVKKRVSKECWGVLFCCSATSAVHIEVSEDYSTDAFLKCMKRFINLRGTPSRMMSDPGSQLVAAADQTKHWNYDHIVEWTSSKKINWHLIPTNSQHFNGQAEALIKVVKKQLTEMMKNRKFTKGELDTLFSDVMQIVNSRPLAHRAAVDPASGGPITPNHLLLGRATIQVPMMLFDHKAKMTKRLAFLDTVRKEFWDKWLNQVFPHLLPSYKWIKEHKNLQAGDVVLMKTESKISSTYRLAVVKSAVPDADGKVRKVMLTYKNVDSGPVYKEKGYKDSETERSVHNLVLIMPVDWKEDEAAGDHVGPRPQENM